MTKLPETIDRLPWPLLDRCSDLVFVADSATGMVVWHNAQSQSWARIAVDTSERFRLADAVPDFARDEPKQQIIALTQGTLAEAELQITVFGTDSGAQSCEAYARRVEAGGRPAVAVLIRRPNTPARQETRHRSDPLTGLPDRSALLDRLEQLVEGDRFKDRQFALLFIDLNDFKQVNDRWGHLVGDRLLCELAQRLIGCLRAGDLLVRYGGDEFVALLESIRDSAAYQPVIERIHTALRKPFDLPDGGRTTISVSVGAVDGGARYRTPLALIDAADRAMYHVKRAGTPA